MKSAFLRVGVFVQNLVFWPLFFSVSLVYIPAATLIVMTISVAVSHRTAMRLTRRAISRYGQLILLCALPFARVSYRDLAPEDGEGPFIFVCNHRSASDPFLMACLPYEAIQVVKQWPFRLPVLGIMARLAGYLSIHEMTLETFWEKAGELYGRGVCLISFPEGTRSGSREMGQFTSAIFRLAKRLQATIVPVAIAGNENIPPKGSLVLPPGLVRVHKLPAIRWQEYKNMPVFKLKNHVRDRLQKHLETIEDRVPPADPPSCC